MYKNKKKKTCIFIIFIYNSDVVKCWIQGLFILTGVQSLLLFLILCSYMDKVFIHFDWRAVITVIRSHYSYYCHK